jgi:protein-S-isoprenylcysteine O-methyltransferase Ste14
MTLTETNSARRALVAIPATAYALSAYLSFLLVSLYGVGFLADAVVPRTVDSGGPASGTLVAVLLDSALLSVFAVQHSVMARPGFKRRWTALVPRQVERATYVLASSAALALAFWQWRPIPTTVWDVSGSGGRVLLWAVYLAGWALVVAMTFAFDHLELVGIRQVRDYLRGLAEKPPKFALPLSHRLVRHPMMTGFLVAFLATPTMTAGHLLFAGLGAAYILVGVRLEERDLHAALPEYAAYAEKTPRFVPRLEGFRGSR